MRLLFFIENHPTPLPKAFSYALNHLRQLLDRKPPAYEYNLSKVHDSRQFRFTLCLTCEKLETTTVTWRLLLVQLPKWFIIWDKMTRTAKLCCATQLYFFVLFHCFTDVYKVTMMYKICTAFVKSTRLTWRSLLSIQLYENLKKANKNSSISTL